MHPYMSMLGDMAGSIISSVLIVVLIVRPAGLLGKIVPEKV